jgi:hypothetical protein
MRIAIRPQLIEDAAAGPNLEAGHDVGRGGGVGMRQLEWTTEKPTQPELYWFRFYPIHEPAMVFVFVHAGIHGRGLWLRHALPLIAESSVSDYDGQWAGPLEPPE